MVLMISDYLSKAKAVPQGTVHTWADGTTRKKIGNKWVSVYSIVQNERKTTTVAEQYFNYALTTNLGGIIEKVLNKHKVKDFKSLTNKIKKGSGDATAHKLYKDIIDTLNSSGGDPEDRKSAAHLIGTALVKLNNHFIGPKVKSLIKVKSKSGKEYYRPPSSVAGVTGELPLLKPSAISRDKKKMGGWSVTGPLKSANVNVMIKKGTAKLISGKVDNRRAWVMPKKAKDIELKYTGNSLLIHVKQERKRKGEKRAYTTARVAITIPYTFAKAFLANQIESKKTQKNLIFRMENSSGYRKFMEKDGA